MYEIINFTSKYFQIHEAEKILLDDLYIVNIEMFPEKSDNTS